MCISSNVLQVSDKMIFPPSSLCLFLPLSPLPFLPPSPPSSRSPLSPSSLPPSTPSSLPLPSSLPPSLPSSLPPSLSPSSLPPFPSLPLPLPPSLPPSLRPSPSLHQIYAETKDDHFHLIVVDYNSMDIDVEEAFKNSSFKRWTVIKINEEFSRSSGLQIGVDNVKVSAS